MTCWDELKHGGGKSWDGVGPPREYKNVHVYIFDDADPTAEPKMVMGQLIPELHKRSCDLIRALFSQLTTAEVHSFRFNKDEKKKKKGVYDEWQRELNTKTKDDLVIVYYHGKAGNEEKHYTWKFSHSYPKGEIDAHRIIGMANASQADCLFLLDCWIHTRITAKWTPPREGTTEIIARPECFNDSDGKVHEHIQDFTTAIVRYLAGYPSEVHYNRHKAHRSIPQILMDREDMYSNPIRIWLDKCYAGNKAEIWRLKINPQTVRETGMLKFVAVPMQLPSQDDDEEEDGDGAEANKIIPYIDETYDSGSDDSDDE